MTIQTRARNTGHEQGERKVRDIVPASEMDGHRRLGEVLTHLGVLAALTEPEAVIALANGVPHLDDETLVRFLYDSRSAA